MRIISFYTPSYREVAKRLINSLDLYGYTYDIVEVPEFVNWREAVAHKPVFIKEKVAQYPGETLVWLDADSEVQADLTFMRDFTADIGVVMDHELKKLHSATMIFKNTPESLFDTWIEESKNLKYYSDQEALYEVLKTYDGKIAEIPMNYTYIFDKPQKENPVIMQYQASRRKRRDLDPEIDPDLDREPELKDPLIIDRILGTRRRQVLKHNYMRTTRPQVWRLKRTFIPYLFSTYPCYVVTKRGVIQSDFEGYDKNSPVIAVSEAVKDVAKLKLGPYKFAYTRGDPLGMIHLNGWDNEFAVPELEPVELARFLGSTAIIEIQGDATRFSMPDVAKEIRGFFEGKGCYIIGKGPSLDMLSEDDFEFDWPVLAINESIHKVETLKISNEIIGIHQDLNCTRNCVPKRSWMIVGPRVAHLYRNRERTFNFGSIMPRSRSLTGTICVELAKLFKASPVVMLCFDAAMGGGNGYAKVIGHKPSGDPKRFVRFRKLFEAKGTQEYRYPKRWNHV